MPSQVVTSTIGRRVLVEMASPSSFGAKEGKKKKKKSWTPRHVNSKAEKLGVLLSPKPKAHVNPASEGGGASNSALALYY